MPLQTEARQVTTVHFAGKRYVDYTEIIAQYGNVLGGAFYPAEV